MKNRNPIQPEGVYTIQKDPCYRIRIGLLHADPNAVQDHVLVLNEQASQRPIDSAIDAQLAKDFMTIAARWPDQSIVTYCWIPHPELWPETSRIFIECFGARGFEPLATPKCLVVQSFT